MCIRISSKVLANRWTPTNTDTDIPKAQVATVRNADSRFIEDASWKLHAMAETKQTNCIRVPRWKPDFLTIGTKITNMAKKVCLHSTMFLARKTSVMVVTICLTVLFFTTYSDSLTPHTVVSDRTFYDRFDDRDQRKKGSFIADIEVPKDQVSSYGTHVYFKLPRFQKYVDPSSPQTSAYNRELNASILRYADILLIKAEAINERDQAPCRAWICIPFAVLRGRVLLSGFTGITGNI